MTATETCISEQTVNSLCFSLLTDDLPNGVQYMFSSNQCYTKVNCISFNRMHTLKEVARDHSKIKALGPCLYPPEKNRKVSSHSFFDRTRSTKDNSDYYCICPRRGRHIWELQCAQRQWLLKQEKQHTGPHSLTFIL